MTQVIAERRLLYSLKSESDRRELTIKIGLPRLVDKEAVDFRADDEAAVCTVELDGLDERNIEVYGADSLHALVLAVDIDPCLRGMTKKYDFYWPSGEPYFGDA
ncbi:MAG: hypothetical protein O3C49_10130 [Proteobacteria bacterium]|nr:hypothetical protein [Pseudomonadota bacterium]MDA1324403.1 hypothetical protein [Pseudomonadota bacterium]